MLLRAVLRLILCLQFAHFSDAAIASLETELAALDKEIAAEEQRVREARIEATTAASGTSKVDLHYSESRRNAALEEVCQQARTL